MEAVEGGIRLDVPVEAEETLTALLNTREGHHPSRRLLGERAVALALASELSEDIKTLLHEAKPYSEGRGNRFSVSSTADVPIVTKRVAIKLTPQ
jgi:hypothetical protein